MDHRHLLPSEFDLLLDGDVGFGVAALRAHARHCPQCRAELEEQRRVVTLLEELPDFAPSTDFADQVMARVQVFEPWHVTARDSLRRLVPRSRPLRVLAGVGAIGMALLVSLAAMAILVRADVALFSLGLLLDRGRTAAVALLGDAVSSLYGEQALRTLATGGPAMVLLGGTLVIGSLVLAALLLRSLAARSRRVQG